MQFIRPAVTFLSIGTIFAYGYALAGMGGYLVGKGSLSYIVWGLLVGTALGAAALWLWHGHPEAFYLDEAAQIEDMKKLKLSLPADRKQNPRE